MNDRIWTVTAEISPLSEHPQSTLYRTWVNLTQEEARNISEMVKKGAVSAMTEEFYDTVTVENDMGYCSTYFKDKDGHFG